LYIFTEAAVQKLGNYKTLSGNLKMLSNEGSKRIPPNCKMYSLRNVLVEQNGNELFLTGLKGLPP
jgi:hypothetical protein